MFFLLFYFVTSNLLISAKLDDSPDDEGAFKVFRVVPTTEKQLMQMIHMFETAHHDDADFWHAPSVVNSTIDVMVSPNKTEHFINFLKDNRFPYQIAIEDLKKLLIEKEGDLNTHDSPLLSKFLLNRMSDDTGDFISRLKMGEYYSYHTIQQWMQRIAEKLPNYAETFDFGTTVEGRKMTGIKFGRDAPGKRAVFIDAGIHAREWTAVHTAMYFITNLVNSRETDPEVVEYLENLVIYIVPVMNPDGYEYTRTDKTNPRARMWRKSRSSAQCAWDGISNSCCQGVDLNRNFDFRFSEIGASKYPCSEIYHGPNAFSEPETRAHRDLMLSLKDKMEAYITLHAYSQLWIYSYSHRKFTYAPDIEETRRVAKKAVNELGKLYGTKFQYGTGPEIIYAFSGGSTDWAKETLKVKYSYTIELRPTYDDWNGFVLEKSQLIPSAKETWVGVKVVLNEVLNNYRHSQRRESDLNKLRAERCVDRLAGCKLWIAGNPNLCRTAQQTMVRDCSRSCDLCHLIAV